MSLICPTENESTCQMHASVLSSLVMDIALCRFGSREEGKKIAIKRRKKEKRGTGLLKDT